MNKYFSENVSQVRTIITILITLLLLVSSRINGSPVEAKRGINQIMFIFAFLSIPKKITFVNSSLLLLIHFCRHHNIISSRYSLLFFLSFQLFGIAGNVNAQSPQTFNSSGTFTVPAGTTQITVQAWGGGGGAGGGATNSRGGGGGGAYAATTNLAVTPGNIITVTVGAGGAAGSGSSAANGTSGGASSFGTQVVAAGGNYGQSGGAGGVGGSIGASTGVTLRSGGNGGNRADNYGGGGGGQAGCSAASGTAGQNGSNPAGGIAGGQTGNTGICVSTGAGGNGGATSINGNNGNAPGGGGGSKGTGSSQSGNGATGRVVITWSTCVTPFTAGITAEYCTRVGYIRLTGNGGGAGATYLWNNGSTTNPIDINIAGQYNVTVTNLDGCSASASYDVSTELVVDGSFTGFVPAAPVFQTEYMQQQSYYTGTATSGLWPEGYYAVNTSAWYDPGTTIGYHPSFHGRDHTNNSVGSRNFMMVNGSTTLVPNPPNPDRQRIIWQQTVTVQPNTDYYFSAWGMNLNPVSPASLQFEVNGVLMGTTANLVTADLPATEGAVTLANWVQFYSTSNWNSGSLTTAVIRIRNLNTIAGGNDFGLDDISFATLAPIPLTINLPPTIAICMDGTLNLPATITGGKAPYGYKWTGPNGFSSSILNPSVSNTTAANAGTYTLTVTDGYGCPAVSASTIVSVNHIPTCSISGSSPLCPGSTGNIYIAPAGMTAYTWSITGNGSVTGSTTGPSVEVTAGATNNSSFTLSIAVINSSGCTSVCQQAFTVEDNNKPNFAVPPPFSECVEILNSAIYNTATQDINPTRPEYYTFIHGDTRLDLNTASFTDNCPLSCAVEIRWKIDMYNGTRIPALPSQYLTGQPSAFGSNIQFFGDGTNFTNVIHTITYWIVDCAGNISDPQTQNITIKPRPNITLIN